MDLDHTAAVARAEHEALACQADEDGAQQRFQAARQQLLAQGRPDEATRSPEFHEWMATRARTDDAWGRWAMAKDAEQG